MGPLKDRSKELAQNGHRAEAGPAPAAPPPAVQEASAGTTEISIQDLIDILLKGKWSIISAFSIVLLAVAVYTFSQDPVYESATVLLVENTKNNRNQRLEDLILGQGNRNVFNEVEILASRKLARGVARRLMESGGENLTTLSPDEEGNPPDLRAVTSRVLGMTDVRPVSKDVDMIRVTVESTNPEEAALVANLYGDVYITQNRLDSRQTMVESKEFLEEQLEIFGEDLGRIEDDLRDFQAEAGVTIDSEAQQLVAQIGQTEVQHGQAKVELGMARARLRALEQQANTVKPGLGRAISSDIEPKIRAAKERIAALEAEIDQVLAKNPSLRGNEMSNPELSQKIMQKEIYEQQIQELTNQYLAEVQDFGGIDPTLGGGGNPLGYVMELQKEIVDTRIQVQGLEATVAELDRQLGRYRGQLGRVPGKAIQQEQLTRQREAREQIYNQILAQLQEVKIAEESEVGYASIVDDAIVPSGPVRPKKSLNLLLGSVFGLVLGLCIVFLRNAMDNRIRKPEDLRKQGVSVLGIVPDMARVVHTDFEGKERITSDGRSYSTNLIALLNPLSPVSETYRRLRTNIQFSRPDQDIQTVLMTSAGPGEGKTVTTANLAITMAQAGRRTLLIDADLRRPTVHKLLGNPREPGLVELLFEKHPLDMEHFATGIDDLYVIPAGSSVPNPAELMGSKKMQELISRLRDEFDYIIIDSPPILAVTDAVLLTAHSDATIVVVSANETDWHSLERALDTLSGVGAPFVGSVLNKFNVKTAYGYYGYRYSYGYGYGYYDYYGEKDGAEEEKPKSLFDRIRSSV